ncbi:unnamed protein product [Aspergillus oryzae]|uniref:Unnamed protein product n=2 Tax=Aspergillus oryzae TaxID=5062 RepID=A0AAN5C462_ASPOZ|nr:unnamed protein product [Aspergillus oryzae]GMF96476.1 unnamed protein product [Aspergillus oryzae]GMG15490.1 unnamed protein product [Aspergillus oryzae]GMG37177.1 unnamed protein product [Aspergillus oryzae]GMG52869.1 unnamed protein product [Aspergillus oryzae var. brunneus]
MPKQVLHPVLGQKSGGWDQASPWYLERLRTSLTAYVSDTQSTRACRPTHSRSIQDDKLISNPSSHHQRSEINMAGPRRATSFSLLYWRVPCIPFLSCSDIPWNASGGFEKSIHPIISSIDNLIV